MSRLDGHSTRVTVSPAVYALSAASTHAQKSAGVRLASSKESRAVRERTRSEPSTNVTR